MPPEEVVEAADAPEPRGHRHLGHGEARVGQEVFRQEEPLGLEVLDRADAVFGEGDPPQVPVGDAEGFDQLGDGAVSQAILLHDARGAPGKPCGGIRRGRPGDSSGRHRRHGR